MRLPFKPLRNLGAVRLDRLLVGRCAPRHTRSLHVFVPKEDGIRRGAVASHWIGKSRLQRFDTVRWNDKTGFIAGSSGGRPVLRDINKRLITPTASINVNTVTFLSRKHGSILLQTI